MLERALEVWEWMVQSHVDACHDASQWQQIVEVCVCVCALTLDYWYCWYTNACAHTSTCIYTYIAALKE